MKKDRFKNLKIRPFLIIILFLTWTLTIGAGLDDSEWTRATEHANWSARNEHTSIAFNNKIWVIGGYDGSLKNDVWYSDNGIIWIQATEHANWGARCRHTSVVFDNKIWVIGGCYYTSIRNDVWYSEDGINWIQATEHANWGAKQDHTSVVFDNKIWVIGGWGYGSSYYNDVWYSEDGINWIRATEHADWSGRDGHTSVVFDDKIWVIGGTGGSYTNDVWYSDNGIIWTRATEHADWNRRNIHTSTVFNNRMWVIGGNNGSNNYNDVWYSTSLTGMEIKDKTTPKLFSLQNIPNPFNISTIISYEIPTAGLVNLQIYNIRGELVKTLLNQHQEPSPYKIIWDATNEKGMEVPSGFYFCRIIIKNEQETKKIVLLK